MSEQTSEQMSEKDKPRPLTREEVEQAIKDLPAHRRDLRDDLKTALALILRGFTVRANAPKWVQAQNVIAVSKVDVDFDSDGRTK